MNHQEIAQMISDAYDRGFISGLERLKETMEISDIKKIDGEMIDLAIKSFKSFEKGNYKKVV